MRSMLPLLRAEALPSRPSWPLARLDVDVPRRHQALAQAAAPHFGVSLYARRPFAPIALPAWVNVPRETLLAVPYAGAQGEVAAALVDPVRSLPTGSDRASSAASPSTPPSLHRLALNPHAEAFSPLMRWPAPARLPGDAPAWAQPLAPLEATVALGLLVARAPRGAETVAEGLWPMGYNDAHRLLLRTRVSAGGTRLPPDHVDVERASFPPPWRKMGRRWLTYARRVSKLDGASFWRAADLLARAQRPHDDEPLAVHWAFGTSRALASGLRQRLLYSLVPEPALAPEGMLYLPLQAYALGTRGACALPPLLSADEELPPVLVPDLVGPTAWGAEVGTWVPLNEERRARSVARRPRG